MGPACNEFGYNEQISFHQNHWQQSRDLFTLSDTDSDPDLDRDIHPKNSYSSHWGSYF